MSDLSRIQSEVENIKSELNNLQIQTNKVKQNMNTQTNKNNKKSAELTNNELATTDYPLDRELKQSDVISITTDIFQNFERSLQKVQNQISKLDNSVNTITDAIDMSSTLERIHNQVYDLKDRFESRVCENFSINNDARILQYVEKNPNNCYILKSDKEDFENDLEDIERLSKELYKLSQDIIQLLSDTDENDIKNEIEESRMKRTQKEYEEMKPYMDLSTIKEICQVDTVINISELKTRLNDNTDLDQVSYDKEDAQRIIENAVDTTPDHSGYNIERVSNERYKITQN